MLTACLAAAATNPLLKGDLDGTAQLPHVNCSHHCALHKHVFAYLLATSKQRNREGGSEGEKKKENENNC